MFRPSCAALLFERVAIFDFLGDPANGMCCVGITQDELKFAVKYGPSEPIKKMPSGCLVTELNRQSYIGA